MNSNRLLKVVLSIALDSRSCNPESNCGPLLIDGNKWLYVPIGKKKDGVVEGEI